MQTAWTKERIEALLMTESETGMRAVGRSLVAIYKYQTADEKQVDMVSHHNGVGFMAAHARVGSSMARWFQEKGFLTPKQVAYWRKPDATGKPRICRYAGQLLRIVEKSQ